MLFFELLIVKIASTIEFICFCANVSMLVVIILINIIIIIVSESFSNVKRSSMIEHGHENSNSCSSILRSNTAIRLSVRMSLFEESDG
jgi:hypothetical protein